MQNFKMMVLENAEPLAIGDTSAIPKNGADQRIGSSKNKRAKPQE